MIVKSSDKWEVPVITETVGEKVYRRLRSDIISGRLAPSQKLRLDALKEAYGVSISTLRELLSRLTSDGLIVSESAKGFEVAPISADNLRELANLRLLLESHALKRSFAAGDMEWEARVVAAYHKLSTMEARMFAGDRAGPEVLKRYDAEFHQALISACGSRTLLEAHAGINDKYIRYLMIAVIFRGDIAASEHKELLDCALKRDVSRAQNILVRHIQDCVSYTLSRGVFDAIKRGKRGPVSASAVAPTAVSSGGGRRQTALRGVVTSAEAVDR
jgi:DNA-binding GntR family transcriptional regulator